MNITNSRNNGMHNYLSFYTEKNTMYMYIQIKANLSKMYSVFYVLYKIIYIFFNKLRNKEFSLKISFRVSTILFLTIPFKELNF